MHQSRFRNQIGKLVNQFRLYKASYIPKTYEVPIYRFWALTAAFFLPLYGIFLLQFDPTAIDYISHRVLLSTYWLVLFGASFYFSNIKKQIILFSHAGNYIWTSWIIWIVYINSFSFNYSIGLFLSFCVGGITFRSVKSMLIFYSIMLSVTFYSLSISEHVPVNRYILGLSLIVVVVVYSIIMYQRSYVSRSLSLLNTELTELNLKLEEKVQARTAIIEENTIKLEAKNKELERFASIASHDLKAPLRSIGAFAGILSKKTAHLQDPKIQECTQYLEGGVKRMTNIIDDLLEYSQLGQAAIVYETKNLDKMLFIVLNSIANNKNRSDVEIAVPQSLPKEVICNARQIEQLFQNLIDNAIKYNRSTIKKVKITYEETKFKWIFTVEDNGIGIPEKYKEQVFEMFKRLHGTQEFNGTGIGLAICKRIVDNHKGTIAIESEEGKGTTFTFSISKQLPTTQKIAAVKEEGQLMVIK